MQAALKTTHLGNVPLTGFSEKELTAMDAILTIVRRGGEAAVSMRGEDFYVYEVRKKKILYPTVK